MYSWILIIPVFIVLFALCYLVIHKVAAVWLNYRLRMVLLERLERKPDLIQQFSEVDGLVDGHDDRQKFDFLITGITLVLFGLVCAVIAQIIGSSRWVVGAYVGGISSITLGIMLSIIGLVIRLLSRNPLKDNTSDR